MLQRKLLNKKKMPLTRAHLLTMDILGRDTLKLLQSDISEQENSTASSDGSTGELFSSDASMASTSTLKENVEPRRRSKRISQAARGSSEEDDEEIRSLKKQKLALEIECAQLKLDNEKDLSLLRKADKENSETVQIV